MSGTLSWELRSEAEETRVSLAGTINEDSRFDLLLADLAEAQEVRFDMGGIERINSIGVREWVNFIRALGEGRSVTLERCAPAVVAQVNMITNFIGDAVLRSVQAPFVCDECGFETTLLLEPLPDEVPSMETRSCPECQAEAFEFDDLPDSYFAFLGRG